MTKLVEQLGQVAGETIGAPALDYLRGKVEKFDVSLSGSENLVSLRDVPFLMVANHLIPESGAAQQSQLSPDAFVLEQLVHELNGQKLRIVAKADDGWWADNTAYRYFQKHISQPLTVGISRGAGFIPVKKNPGSLNRGFVETMDTVMKDKDPVLIFPEGHWYEDWNWEHRLEPGAAFLAKKYGLPVLPTYVKGARSWKPGTEVFVSFGEPFAPGEMSKEGITEQIRRGFQSLQEEFPLRFKARA